MRKGISPVTLRRSFNPKPHAGTDARLSSLCPAVYAPALTPSINSDEIKHVAFQVSELFRNALRLNYLEKPSGVGVVAGNQGAPLPN
jgi:hypothetical protein